MTAQAPVRTLFRCDGATVPPALACQHWDHELVISSWGPNPTLNLRLDGLDGKVLGSIDHRANDLIRIATYAYAADQMVTRGGSADANRAHWRRVLTLCVPVADPVFWTEPGIQTQLSEILGFLTEDAWAFAFDQGGSEVRQLRLAMTEAPRPVSPDSVILFSGGVDSLCALVEAAAARGAHPVVVSHRPAPQIDRWQRDLLKAVAHHLPGWTFPHLSFWIHRRGSEATDSRQRSRAFLFACLGAAVAGQVGLSPVLLPDNGYVSINPPISGQLVGALASRATHPTFLRLFNRLVGNVFTHGVHVANPLRDRTRAEALQALVAAGCTDLVQQTRSCSKHRGRPREKPHCGSCSQCVDRRFAALAAGLETHDRVARYGLDLFVDALPEGEPRTIVEAYVRFALETERRSADALFDAYPELAACLDPDDPQLPASALGLAELLQRHAAEVLGVLAEQVQRHRDALVRKELPAHCLLSLAVTPQATPATDTSPPSVVPISPGVPVTPLDADAGTPPEHRLVHKGQIWWIEFRGETAVYPTSVGMIRLARLLKAPGQEISALDLITGAVSGSVHPPQGGTAQTGDADAPRPAAPGGLGDVLDPESLRRYKQEAAEIGKKLAAARHVGDADTEDTLHQELKWIERQVKGGQGLHGPRQIPDEYEKARQAVSRSVIACIETFQAEMPEFHAHLKHWVHLGLSCSYAPHPPERWHIAG